MGGWVWPDPPGLKKKPDPDCAVFFNEQETFTGQEFFSKVYWGLSQIMNTDKTLTVVFISPCSLNVPKKVG